MIEYKSGDIRYFIKTSIFIFILLLSVFLTLIYFYSRNYIINEIDKRLLVAAESIKHILPSDYHDRAVNPDSITENEYLYAERKLSEYAEKVGLEYIWTDIEYNGGYYLTSSNKTDESSEEGLEIYYFMKYEDGVSVNEQTAFDSDEPVFTYLHDKWGSFRAVFIPSVSPYGNKYLSCAEYTVDYVDELLKNSVIITLVISLMLFLVFIPFFSIYIIYAGKKETELKSKNKEFEETTENLKITLHSISDGVIVTDSNAGIRIMNKAAEEISGYSLKDIFGYNITEILKIHDPESLKELKCPVTEVINTGKKVEIANNVIIFTKDKRKIRISKSASPIITGNNELIGVVTVIRDMSSQFRLEEELQQARNIESVGKLAGGIAHDFNNMLGAILSSAELLQLKIDDSKAQEYIKIIIDITHKAAELTANLLTFSRKSNKNIEIFNINRAVNNVVSILLRNFNKNIVIKTFLKADNKYIKGDLSAVETALYNICVNSKDAMPFGGMLNIYSENEYLDREFCNNTVFDINEGNYIKLIIKDTGSGIDKEIMNNIFDPYFTYGKNNSFSGIGLSVVYGTVVEHNGAVYVESSDKNGTVFSLYFPLADKPQ